ncbi:MAG: hypothetical protein NTY01_02175 [Verrucomicrobia bacterium]|nr:hypothetical protein [Verrucomicrobiota bacterium]
MKTRTFFLASVLTAMAAICLQNAALSLISQGVVRRVKMVTASEEQRQQIRSESKRYIVRGQFLAGVGLATAGLSVACLAVSIRRHESGRRSIPITLLVCYLLFLLVVV